MAADRAKSDHRRAETQRHSAVVIPLLTTSAVATELEPMPSFLADLRFAIRSLRRAPGFLIVTVLALALGIGATTSIFSVVYGVLLRPLPYPDAERIVELRQISPRGGQSDFSDANFQDLRA